MKRICMNIRLAHVLVDDYVFTSHGHGDVKLIMWAHVGHGAELTRHERWCFLITQCVRCVLRPKIVACTQDVNRLT